MSYTIYYHGGLKVFRGRADPIMALLNHVGKPYEGAAVDAIPKDFPTFACPVVTFPDGTTIAQTPAIMMALGKTEGLYPQDSAGEMRGWQLVLDAADLFSEGWNNKGDDKKEEFQKEGGRLAKWLAHLENALEVSNGDYLFGDQITYVDFMLFMTTSGIRAIFSKAVFGEKLAKWEATMSSLEAYKKFEGGPPLMP